MERGIAAEVILLFSLTGMQASLTDLEVLYNLVLETSRLITPAEKLSSSKSHVVRDEESVEKMEQRDRLVETCLLLCCAILTFCNGGISHDVEVYGVREPRQLRTFFDNINRKLKDAPAGAPFLPMLRFCHSVFILALHQSPFLRALPADVAQSLAHSMQPEARRAMHDGLFQDITEHLASSWFAAARARPLCAKVLDDMVTSIVLQNPLRQLLDDQAEAQAWAHADSRGNGGAGGERPLFDVFLDMMASVYTHVPHEALKYWTDDRLRRFMELAGEALVPSYRVPSREFLRMMGSLGRDERCAEYAYAYFDKNFKSDYATWSYFFKWLERYRNMKLQHQKARVDVAFQTQHHAQRDLEERQRAMEEQQRARKWEDHLKEFLQMTQAILENSHTSRMLMVSGDRRREWGVLELLFGLFTAAIPADFKAEVVRTIAVFAKSREIIPQIWSLLERSQVLQARGAGSNGQLRGMAMELEYERVSDPEYPITRAFLGLLRELWRNGGPQMHRSVGTDGVSGMGMGGEGAVDVLISSLYFVRHVFDHFQGFEYRHTADRWKIAALSLEIFHVILDSYDPSPSVDLVPSRATTQSGSNGLRKGDSSSGMVTYRLIDSPGKVLMADFLSGALVHQLEVILRVAAGGEGAFSDAEDEGMAPVQTRGAPLEEAREGLCGEDYEHAVRLALGVIDMIVVKREPFLRVLRMADNPPQITAEVHELMHRSIVDIAWFVDYAYDDEICLYAVRILSRMSLRCRNLVSILRQEQRRGDTIIRKISERLLMEEAQPVDSDGKENSGVQFYNSVRFWILRMLLENLDRPRPNLTHFLLEMPQTLSASSSSALLPAITVGGRRGTSSGHASRQVAISLPESMGCLHAVLVLVEREEYFIVHPQLVEICFEFIYRLVADPITSAASLSLLRTRWKAFYCALVDRQNWMPASFTDGSTHVMQFLLRQQAWFLRVIALELHVSATGDQHIGGQHCKRMLQMLFESSPTPEDIVGASFSEDQEVRGVSTSQRMRMLAMLDSVVGVVGQATPAPLSAVLRYFTVEGDGQSLYHVDRHGVALYDIPRLHTYLVRQKEQAELYGRQKEQVERELAEVLRQAVRLNAHRSLENAQLQLFSSWKAILEVALGRCFDVLQLAQREPIEHSLFDLLVALLRVSAHASRQLSAPIAEASLMLMAKLREMGPSGEKGAMPIERLTFILRCILQGLLRNGESQHTRAYLYATLLNYLQHTQASSERSRTERAMSGDYVDEVQAQQLQLERNSISILREYGEKLVAQICTDAADSSEVWRAVAMSALDSLCAYGPVSGSWIQLLDRQGFIRHFEADDAEVLDLVQLEAPPATALQKLFAFESKMSLLVRIANTRTGADRLLANNVISRLMTLKFINERPEQHYYGGRGASNHPSPLYHRYERLLTPVLRLLHALLTVFPENDEVASQALRFFDRHGEVFESIMKDELRARDQAFSASSLVVLQLLSGILYCVFRRPQLVREYFSHRAHTFKTVMVRLFSKFLTPYICRLVNNSPGHTVDVQSVTGKTAALSFAQERRSAENGEEKKSLPLVHDKNVTRALLGIQRNLVAFTRVVTEGLQESTQGSMNAMRDEAVEDITSAPIFTSSFEEALRRPAVGVAITPQDTAMTAAPSLGQCVAYLNEVAGRFSQVDAQSEAGMSTCFIVENVLLVVARHLQYYARQATNQQSVDLLREARVALEPVENRLLKATAEMGGEEGAMEEGHVRAGDQSGRLIHLLVWQVRHVRQEV